VTPPEPVLVATPPGARLNQTSSVKFDAPRPGATPNVTYWSVPLKLSAVFWADASAPKATRRAARTHRDERESLRAIASSFIVHLSAQ
jgi:hypothetical protein